MPNPNQKILRFTQENSKIAAAALGFLSAVFLILAFSPYSKWFLVFLGMIPYFFFVFQSQSPKKTAWFGFFHMNFFVWMGFYWIAFVATNFGGLPWIVGKLVLLAYSLVGEIQFLAFALFTYYWIKKRGKLAVLDVLFLPAAYVALDYLNPKLFPNTLGLVLYPWLSVVQIVEWTGVYFLTYWIVLTNLVLFLLFLKPVQSVCTKKQLSVLLSACFIVFGVAHFWGTHRIAELKVIEKKYFKPFRVSVIQANIGDLDKLASENGFGPAIKRVLDTYHDMTVATVKSFKPELVIWPETAYPYLYSHMMDLHSNQTGAAKDQWIADLIKETNTPLYFGTYSMLGSRDYNSAFLVAPPFNLLGMYRKTILLAFGEYVPLGPFSDLVQKEIPSIADFGRGQGATTIDFKGIHLAPQICYEGIFPEHSRDGVKLGADLLLNITNDSWFGEGSEPWLHLLLTVFRSIELRRPMIRGTNTGVSVAVDLTGKTTAQTTLFEKQIFEQVIQVPASDGGRINTFYLKVGEWFAKACFLVFFAVFFILFFYPWLKVCFLKKKTRGRSRRHS